MRYPQDLRNSIVKRLLSEEINYEEAAQEYGVSKQSLYHWVSEARKKARTVSRRTTNHNEMSTNIPLPNGISFTKMYHAYVLCQHFGLDSTQAGQICRREGLMMEDVKTFAKAVRNLDLTDPKEVESLVSTSKQNRSKIKALESENRKAQTEIAKKDKVTAELSALLVLSKKAEAIWGDKES